MLKSIEYGKLIIDKVSEEMLLSKQNQSDNMNEIRDYLKT